MSQMGRTITGIVIVAVIVVIAALGYVWFSGGSGAASATLSAPTLAIAAPTDAPTEPTEAPTAMPEATSEAAETTMTFDATAEATPEATAAAEADTTAMSAESEPVVYNITTDGSEVRFILNEVLNGQPTRVVGRTNQIAGQLAIDFANPATAQVGEIRISARSLATDSEMRNRTIRGQILQSAQDQYEFISFQPTEISGLPESVTMGEPVEFRITGDLTIRSITKPVTFTVTVTPESEAEISGTASATVQRADFELTIPRVPSVADVDEAVQLEIDFTAIPAV